MGAADNGGDVNRSAHQRNHGGQMHPHSVEFFQMKPRDW